MQRKAFLIFFVVSAILMSGYLICMATSPAPGWAPIGSLDTGLQSWAHHDSADGRAYCAYNYYTTGGVIKWRTYHWGHLDADSDKKFDFQFEWKRGEASFVQDINPNIRNVYDNNWGSYDITSNTLDPIWESEWWSPELTVNHNQSLSPYSSIKSIEGIEDSSQARFDPVTIP